MRVSSNIRTASVSAVSAAVTVALMSMLGSGHRAETQQAHSMLWVSDDGTGLVITPGGGVRVVESNGFRPNLRQPGLDTSVLVVGKVDIPLMFPPAGTKMMDPNGVVVGTMTEKWLVFPTEKCPLFGDVPISIVGPRGDGFTIQYPQMEKAIPIVMPGGEGISGHSLVKAIERYQGWYELSLK